MIWKEPDFKNNLDNVKAVLLYGPDAGRADEYCDLAIEKLQIDRDNLFALDADDMGDKADALFAECCSPSMFGGRKLVIISNAGDSASKNIAELVSTPGLYATVIVVAGELRTGGSLRKLFEDGKDIAALPCYTDDARTLAPLIRSELEAAGIRQITPDALAYMMAHMGGDRAITRGFLKKIALYVDDKKTVELDDVEKCLPDTGAVDMDDYLYSLTAGHLSQTMIALDRLVYGGVDPNAIVSMLNVHFKRLLVAVVDGKIPPNVFYKVRERFERACKFWTADEIVGVLKRLTELQGQLRTRGAPGETLIRDFSLKLALRANKLAFRRRS